MKNYFNYYDLIEYSGTGKYELIVIFKYHNIDHHAVKGYAL